MRPYVHQTTGRCSKNVTPAARLDRLKQDQSLLALLLGQDGEGKSGFGGAFAPEPGKST